MEHCQTLAELCEKLSRTALDTLLHLSPATHVGGRKVSCLLRRRQDCQPKDPGPAHPHDQGGPLPAPSAPRLWGRAPWAVLVLSGAHSFLCVPAGLKLPLHFEMTKGNN